MGADGDNLDSGRRRFMVGAAGLTAILGGAASAMSAVPVADAGIALVPGLHGMSRVTNNAELDRLWQAGQAPGNWPQLSVYAVSSDYDPPKVEEPWWNLWSRLKGPQKAWSRATVSAAPPGVKGGTSRVPWVLLACSSIWP